MSDWRKWITRNGLSQYAEDGKLSTPVHHTTMIQLLSRVLDPVACHSVADMFAYLAHMARTRAEEIEANKRLWENPAPPENSPLDMLIEHVKSGQTIDAAVQSVVNVTGFDRVHLLAAYHAWSGRQAKAVRDQRDLEIMRLAGRGYTNAKIVESLDRQGFGKIHPKHVSRIIRTRLRKANSKPPPEPKVIPVM